MADRTILVTGATGNTGGAALRELLKTGHTVRALVRDHDPQSDALRALGAEIAVGNFLDVDSMRAAMENVGAAYFVYPLAPQLLEGAVNFAQAASEAGVGAIVELSQKTARRDSKSHAAQNHWLAERLFDRCGVPVTHLRPTLFAEWVLYPFAWSDDEHKDTFALPFGLGRFAPIASEDQGRTIAAILADPARHAGRTYDLFGPMELDGHEIAAAVGEALGRPVRYEPIEIEQFLTRLRTVPGYATPYIEQHLSAIAIDCRNGVTAGTNDAVERITGRVPLGVAEFVQHHRTAFDSPHRTAKEAIS